MFARCRSQEIKTAENLASDPTKPGRRSWPAAWMLWLASIDQLAAPTWPRQTSSSVSSNIIIRMLYNIPFSTSLYLPDWIWLTWASSTHLDTKWRALITWAALAPSTSLAGCLIAFASPKAALNSASGVHCFQAPLPFGFGLASSRGCKGNMWSIVLWRAEAFETIACHLKHCALWSVLFFSKNSAYLSWHSSASPWLYHPLPKTATSTTTSTRSKTVLSLSILRWLVGQSYPSQILKIQHWWRTKADASMGPTSTFGPKQGSLNRKRFRSGSCVETWLDSWLVLGARFLLLKMHLDFGICILKVLFLFFATFALETVVQILTDLPCKTLVPILNDCWNNGCSFRKIVETIVEIPNNFQNNCFIFVACLQQFSYFQTIVKTIVQTFELLSKQFRKQLNYCKNNFANNWRHFEWATCNPSPEASWKHTNYYCTCLVGDSY